MRESIGDRLANNGNQMQFQWSQGQNIGVRYGVRFLTIMNAYLIFSLKIAENPGELRYEGRGGRRFAPKASFSLKIDSGETANE
jgi:hypothetical protein